LGAPHLVDEVILPTLREGDSQILVAVQDRPWPPWGLGARNISAMCQTHLVSDNSYSVSPVYVTDEDATNVGMISAVYKEALEQLAVNPRAEVCYLVAEGSTLVDYVLTSNGFRKSDDVFVNFTGRYYTYRADAAKLLSQLSLEKTATPDLLAHDIDAGTLANYALLHQTLYLGSRAQWTLEKAIPEVIWLPRGGHAGKPGGVPSGTSGRFIVDPEIVFEFAVTNFLGEARQKLLDFVVSQEQNFRPATIIPRGEDTPSVNPKLRKGKTLDKLGDFEWMIAERVKEQLEPTLKQLNHKAFPVGRIEVQATASNDGDYFRLHTDSDSKDTREISFVYFFHGEPRRFSGGELRLYATRFVNGELLPADHSQTISPRQDTIVFFPSLNEHELLPVRVPSQKFADSRFTINGWIHRQN
jgi:Rps23 Pro-64 3,4-dihydroxylase Tpa1-like proline 4-hydroxylase